MEYAPDLKVAVRGHVEPVEVRRSKARAKAHRILGRMKTGITLSVCVDRVMKDISGKSSVVEQQTFEATLLRRTPEDFSFTFRDDDQNVYSLVEEDEFRRIFLHSYAPRISGTYGLPPSSEITGDPLIKLTTNAKSLEHVVYCGFATSRSSQEAACAIVSRFPVTEEAAAKNQLVDTLKYSKDIPLFWLSETDLCEPVMKWIEPECENTYSRCYNGGSEFNLSVVAALAAVRCVKSMFSRFGSQNVADSKQSSAPRAVIVLERHSAQQNFNIFRQLASSSSHLSNQSKTTTRLFDLLHKEWAQIRSQTTIVQSDYSFVATSAAETKRRKLPSIGERLSADEASFFESFMPTAEDVKHRIKLQEHLARQNTLASPVVNNFASSVRTVEDFVNTCRRCKARSYVPRSAKAAWGTLLSTQLASVIKLGDEFSEHNERLDDAMIALLLLPQAYLPVRGTQEMLASRMCVQKPWNISKTGPHEPETGPHEPETGPHEPETKNETRNETKNETKNEKQQKQKTAGNGIQKQKSQAEQKTKTKTENNSVLSDDSAVSGNTNALINKTNKEEIQAVATTRVLMTDTGRKLHEMAVQTGVTDIARQLQADARQKLNLLVQDQMDEAAAEVEILSNPQAAGATHRARKLIRLAEAVERLACDYKIRSAVKLLMTTVDSMSEGHIDIPFEDKVKALMAKIAPVIADAPPANADTSKSPACPTFNGNCVRRALSKMPTQAATCIDSWSPRLLIDAIDVYSGISDQLGHVCAMILNGAFSERVMNILRAGRAVLIPKDGGEGIRPITLSSFFVKLSGGLVFQAYFPHKAFLDGQYGLGTPDGVARIAHAVRRERELGAAIVRIDVSNAFGVCPRHLIALALNEMSVERNAEAQEAQKHTRDTANAAFIGEATQEEMHNSTDGEWIDYAFLLKRYFNTIYGSNSAKLAIYGPLGKTEFVDVETGIRQGDIFSTYFFSLVLNEVRKDILRQLPFAIVRLFVDDITITVPPQHAKLAWYIAMNALKRVGMTANASKSKILCNDPGLINAYEWPLIEDGSDIHKARCEETQKLLDTIPECEKTPNFNYGRKYPEPYDKVVKRVGGKLIRNVPIEMRAKFRAEESSIAKANLFFQWRNMMEHTPFVNDTEESDDPFAAVTDAAPRFNTPKINDEAIAATADIRIASVDEMFVVVGANISENYEMYNERQIGKVAKFFNVLREVALHEQLSFTLARISGFMRPRFFASCNPPDKVASAVAEIQKITTDYLSELLLIPVAGEPYAHTALGLGIPDYVTCQQILYQENFNTVLGVQMQETQLVNLTPSDDSEERTAWLSAQTTAPWLFYQPRGMDTRLTSPEFRFAMAIRCGTIPLDILHSSVPSCTCSNVKFNSTLAIVKHAMNCDCNGFSPATRHNFVKCAIAAVIRRYNLPVQLEPLNYCSDYTDARKHRPDLLVYTSPPVCTDFVVSQQTGKTPGPAATAAANRKRKQHQHPVSLHGHAFIPFSMEVNGHCDKSVTAFAQAVSAHLPRYEMRDFVRDIHNAAAVALVRARIHAVSSLYRVGTFTYHSGDALPPPGDADVGIGLAL